MSSCNRFINVSHGFHTHQPFFLEILKNTTGNILECGCGDGSTMMIKEEIKNTGRKLVSLESNLEWLNKYQPFADENHTLYHVDAGNADTTETGNAWVEFIKEKKLDDFEIVFLDSAPWSSRKSCFDYFLNKAKIIIFHDFDYYPVNNIIGNVIRKEETYYEGKLQQRIVCNLDGIVKHYKLFYPPNKYFIGLTGPPTLVCSNTMDQKEFQELVDLMEKNVGSYYS